MSVQLGVRGRFGDGCPHCCHSQIRFSQPAPGQRDQLSLGRDRDTAGGPGPQVSPLGISTLSSSLSRQQQVQEDAVTIAGHPQHTLHSSGGANLLLPLSSCSPGSPLPLPTTSHLLRGLQTLSCYGTSWSEE